MSPGGKCGDPPPPTSPDGSNMPRLERSQVRGELPKHLLDFPPIKTEGRGKEGGII